MLSGEKGQNGVAESQASHGFGELIPGLQIVIGIQPDHHNLVLIHPALDLRVQVFDGFENGVKQDVLAGPVVQLLDVD